MFPCMSGAVARNLGYVVSSNFEGGSRWRHALGISMPFALIVARHIQLCFVPSWGEEARGTVKGALFDTTGQGVWTILCACKITVGALHLILVKSSADRRALGRSGRSWSC